MASTVLRRVWLDDDELDIAWARLSEGQQGALKSWGVQLQLSGFPAGDILNLRETEFRAEIPSGAAVSGHALLSNVQVSSTPVLSLVGSGPIKRFDG